MKRTYRLFSADPEILGGDGPSNVVPLAAATAEPPAAPNFLQKAAAVLSSKATLLSERDAITLRCELAEAKVANQESQLAALQADLTTLQAERVELEALMDSAAKERQSVEVAATSQIAALGFAVENLPAAIVAAMEDVPTLIARMDATTDEKEKYRLAAKINALESGN